MAAQRVETRRRRTIKMFFDVGKQIEADLYAAAMELRANRQLAPTLRLGLKFFLDLQTAEKQLQRGEQPAFNAISLLELHFPKVVEWIAARFHSQELAQVRGELEALKIRMELMSTLPAPVKIHEPAPEMVIKKSSKKADVAANFFKSIGGFGK